MTLQKITGTIRKIHLFYAPDTGTLCAMRLYDTDAKIIYESAWKYAFTYSGEKQHEILLNEGERIVGFQCREYEEGTRILQDF